MPARPKSRSNKSSAVARSVSAASRTSTGGSSMRGRHSHTTCALASAQSTNVPQRLQRSTAGLAPIFRTAHAGTTFLPLRLIHQTTSGEHRHGRQKRSAKQPERVIENRFCCHPRFHPKRRARQTIAKRSVPRRGCCPARSPSGELWKWIRLGRCTRNATNSAPFQPTSPTRVPAERPDFLDEAKLLFEPDRAGNATRRAAPDPAAATCRSRRAGRGRTAGRAAEMQLTSRTITPGASIHAPECLPVEARLGIDVQGRAP